LLVLSQVLLLVVMSVNLSSATDGHCGEGEAVIQFASVDIRGEQTGKDEERNQSLGLVCDWLTRN
jgi:hypothetical protein